MSTATAVHIVHCVDTEGPLYEPLEVTFERLRDIFQLELTPTIELLRRLQAGELDLGGLESAVQRVVSPHLLEYNDTWDKVDAMLTEVMHASFRTQLYDSAGNGWIYNWFCVDHVDYDWNPRRRDIGYHNIFKHYQRAMVNNSSLRDGLHFHYHPHPFSRQANHSATHWWASSDSLHQILSRRVIDHHWFPAAHRAGFHVTRPDSHWFLEQHIPFDFSNQAVDESETDSSQAGVSSGRFGDWRRATRTWTPYHPSADDYQLPGHCRRWIARCLNIGTRYRLLKESDVRQAFKEADCGRPAVLSFTNHDFRNISSDVMGVVEILRKMKAEFPDVPFLFSEAVTAMRSALNLPVLGPCELKISIEELSTSRHIVKVSSEVPTFGPQPWLALKTAAGTYHFDNFDIDMPFHKWQYVLDEETLLKSALSAIGIAANNSYGITSVVVIDPHTETAMTRYWNMPESNSLGVPDVPQGRDAGVAKRTTSRLLYASMQQ